MPAGLGGCIFLLIRPRGYGVVRRPAAGRTGERVSGPSRCLGSATVARPIGTARPPVQKSHRRETHCVSSFIASRRLASRGPYSPPHTRRLMTDGRFRSPPTPVGRTSLLGICRTEDG